MLARDIKLFGRCLLPAFVLTALFAIVCALAAFGTMSAAENKIAPLKVNVVDNEDTAMSRILVNVVMEMDYISSLLDIEKSDYAEAVSNLESGKSIAAIILPESFVGDIAAGRNAKGQIILSHNAASYSDMVAEVASFGELLLAAGQYGVFCGQEIIAEHKLGSAANSVFLERTNKNLLNEAIVAGEKYFEISVADFADTDMSAVSYYSLCWLVLLLFLCGNFFSELCLADMNRSMLCRLRALGVGDIRFAGGKVMLPFIFRLLLCAALLLLAGRFIEIENGLYVLAVCVLSLLFISLFSSTVIMLRGWGIMCNTAFAACGLFLCGGLVPRQMLADGLLFFGDITPFGAALNLFAPLLGGDLKAACIIALAAYSLLCILLLRRRLQLLRSGGETQ